MGDIFTQKINEKNSYQFVTREKKVVAKKASKILQEKKVVAKKASKILIRKPIIAATEILIQKPKNSSLYDVGVEKRVLTQRVLTQRPLSESLMEVTATITTNELPQKLQEQSLIVNKSSKIEKIMLTKNNTVEKVHQNFISNNSRAKVNTVVGRKSDDMFRPRSRGRRSRPRARRSRPSVNRYRTRTVIRQRPRRVKKKVVHHIHHNSGRKSVSDHVASVAKTAI